MLLQYVAGIYGTSITCMAIRLVIYLWFNTDTQADIFLHITFIQVVSNIIYAIKLTNAIIINVEYCPCTRVMTFS